MVASLTPEQDLKDELLSAFAHFSWSFGTTFFVEVENLGNFIWSDPEYGGDNTMKRVHFSHNSWVHALGITYSRDKGIKLISKYCGEDFKVIL